MNTTSRKSRGIDSSLKSLSISPSSKTKAKAPRAPPPDSWEDAAASTSSSTGSSPTPTPSPPSTPRHSPGPAPPPPTPISPTHSRGKSTDWAAFTNPYSAPSSISTTTSPRAARSERDVRPEKSSAAAGRMIAGALGVKAPRPTEEGRKYERAVREKERKRREREREEEEKGRREREEARRLAWEG